LQRMLEPGAKYPREVAPPLGLPSGWKAVERAYTASSKSYGRTYIRYDSLNGKHKTLSSVKLCIQKDAEDKGQNPDKAVKAWEKSVEDMKEAKKKEKEDAGMLAGEKRDQAVEAFRAKYGALDGATVCNLPGWRAESIYRESCQQTAVTYYSPEGKPYGTVKSIEAFFGIKVLAGNVVPAVELARSKVAVDEKGRPINEARKEINNVRTMEGETKVQKRPRHLFDEEQYKECGLLAAPTRQGLSGKRVDALGLAAPERERLAKSAVELRERLLSQHFAESSSGPGLVLAVVGCPAEHQLSKVLNGLFYQMPEAWNGRPCYQSVFVSPGGALACRGVYIFWSPDRSCWKIGPLNDAKAGFAFCVDDRPQPTELEAPWRIYTPE